MATIDLTNRLKKRYKHLAKWAGRNTITCYRLYDRDLTDFPLIIDYYDGHAIAWVMKETDTQDLKYAISEGLGIAADHVILKDRSAQIGLTGQHQKVNTAPQLKLVQEGGLTFEINLTNYLDIGLFLDHRKTREKIKTLSKGKRILNLFAYTGSFTCYAIDGGATSSTTVDMNPNYAHWVKRNFELNHIHTGKDHQIVTEDCFSFLRDHQKAQKYDIIICDPPTFSNSKRMEMKSFSVDRDYPILLNLCLNILSPDGVILFSNNSRQFKMDTTQLLHKVTIQEITHQTISEDFKDSKSHRAWVIAHHF